MKFIFMIFVFLLIGCGAATETKVEVKKVEIPVDRHFYINPSKVSTKVLPFVMEFAGYCEAFGVAELCKENFKKILAVKTVPSFKEKYVVGKCFVSPAGGRWIEILDGWADVNSFASRTVVIHELAHCVLGKGLGEIFPHHDEEKDIMNSYLLDDKTIFTSWPKLLKKMFLRAGGKLYLTEETETSIVTQTLVNELGEVSCDEATTD